jgi:cytoskeletal protein RodZ
MPTDLTRNSDLADHRRAKGITLGTIESSTRIGRHFLEAIEAEDFSRLPGGVYNVSYLRQYAKASGFDESVLLRRYYEQVEPPQLPEPVPSVWSLRGLRAFEPLRVLTWASSRTARER